ncbi:MAG: glycosyltransferase family 2 protein [Desulfobulbus sp.]|jgi:glycosyltransferase involved in cell wall biosynthesis
MNKVSVYIIAYNEADKIEAAINSVLWADEIVLVDSHSTDDTVAIAERLGARVVQVPFTSFGDLRNRAMAACEHDWIFSLDSDERCTPEARDEILACLQAPQAEAYYIPRRNFFMGQWIRYSGYYPDYRQPQLFKKGALVFKDGDPVHEEFRVVSSQPVAYLKNPIWQIPFARLGELMRKAERYSTLGAEKLEKNGKRGSMWQAMAHAVWAFFHMYILKRGFLDGWPGFLIAFSSFESTLFKYAKLYERQANWQPPPSPPLQRR